MTYGVKRENKENVLGLPRGTQTGWEHEEKKTRRGSTVDDGPSPDYLHPSVQLPPPPGVFEPKKIVKNGGGTSSQILDF